jgi:hypothetical protein
MIRDVSPGPLDLDFFHPGSRKSTGPRIPDLDPQHCYISL